jgi:hypothetical protein
VPDEVVADIIKPAVGGLEVNWSVKVTFGAAEVIEALQGVAVLVNRPHGAIPVNVLSAGVPLLYVKVYDVPDEPIGWFEYV